MDKFKRNSAEMRKIAQLLDEGCAARIDIIIARPLAHQIKVASILHRPNIQLEKTAMLINRALPVSNVIKLAYQMQGVGQYQDPYGQPRRGSAMGTAAMLGTGALIGGAGLMGLNAMAAKTQVPVPVAKPHILARMAKGAFGAGLAPFLLAGAGLAGVGAGAGLLRQGARAGWSATKLPEHLKRIVGAPGKAWGNFRADRAAKAQAAAEAATQAASQASRRPTFVAPEVYDFGKHNYVRNAGR